MTKRLPETAALLVRPSSTFPVLGDDERPRQCPRAKPCARSAHKRANERESTRERRPTHLAVRLGPFPWCCALFWPCFAGSNRYPGGPVPASRSSVEKLTQKPCSSPTTASCCTEPTQFVVKNGRSSVPFLATNLIEITVEIEPLREPS
ncbi:hypothetical protein pipiens_017284 [Culex pipiens pipiens]|uniref:Uncharacterized protein n=1 Tax=Culex pipiens pipiens TaxID=38569 RepID=A0ABD1CHC5_CULPP